MTAWGKLIAATGSLANTVGADQPFRYRGAHYNRAIYDRRGQFKEWSEHRCITAKMRRLCKDIIIDKK